MPYNKMAQSPAPYNKMAQSLPLRTAPTIVYLMPPEGGLILLPQTPLREKSYAPVKE